MKTRVIQDEPDDGRSAQVGAPTMTQPTGSRIAWWIRNHRLITFFVLAYVFAWWAWPLYGIGVWPELTFFAFGPSLSAIVVIAVAEGRAGFRDLGVRIIRWRVPWYWYAVALGLPLALRFLTAVVNANPGGAPAPHWFGLAWGSFLFTFLVRLVNPLDGPAGEEPGWRGFAVPRLQAGRSPLVTAVVLAALVTGWHLPLVVAGDLGPIGLVSTFSITIVYVWLFNRTGGSVLLTLLFHSAQGAVRIGDLGFTGADLARQEWMECVAWSAVAIGVIALDRSAWRAAPAAAVYRPQPPVVAADATARYAPEPSRRRP
jgi:uncharacterized protein